jgi:anti-sigma factor ChrR (cupin superfamily)
MISSLRSNFAQRELVHSEQEEWLPSPMAGVHRRMLDRIGGEVARATTIVRFDPGSVFSAHTHKGGEEFIVLEGVFQDEHRDYPKGTYCRNPPTTFHTPRSDDGCTIMVKLWQFDLEDRNQFHMSMAATAAANTEDSSTINGVKRTVLHSDPRETVYYIEAEAGADVCIEATGGAELLMISGTMTTTDRGEVLTRGSWLREPDGEIISAKAGKKPCVMWVKVGHLLHARAPEVE